MMVSTPHIHINWIRLLDHIRLVSGRLVDTTAVICVEEVLVIVLVSLPLREQKADDQDDGDQNEAEGVVVDAEGLSSALTTWLIACQRTEVQRPVHAEHRLRVGRLRVESYSSCSHRRRDRLNLK